MTERTIDAYEAGAQAAQSGLDLTHNPHLGNMRNTQDAINWAKGWHSQSQNYVGQAPLSLDDV